MSWERPTAEQVAERAVEVAKLTLRKVNEDPELVMLIGSSVAALMIGAVVADAISNLDDSAMRVRDAINAITFDEEGRTR